jgi:leucyl aminopeptidase
METMKCDMAGAAAVLAATKTIAELGLPVRISAYLACAENMPSGTAQRPGDVITMRNGTTVEVLNTDAEGRLVMADALVLAAEGEPEAIVDVATLTGAQMIALGTHVAAVMSNDDSLSERVRTSGESVGERFWPMPLPEALRAGLTSRVADLKNIGEPMGGMLIAGLFLKAFVPDGQPWAHLDIAGPAWNDASAHGFIPAGGTGFAARTLIAMARAGAAA